MDAVAWRDTITHHRATTLCCLLHKREPRWFWGKARTLYVLLDENFFIIFLIRRTPLSGERWARFVSYIETVCGGDAGILVGLRYSLPVRNQIVTMESQMKLVGGVLKSSLAGLFLVAACGGNGDGEDKVRGTQLVAGVGLKIEDVSADGTLIAYSDAAGKVFLVEAAGGDPTEIADGVDDAKFKGNILVLFTNISGIDQTAQTLQFVSPGSTTATTATATGVKVDSVRASEDSAHLFFETVDSAFLDDSAVVLDSAQIRGRFTADNQFLVVASNSNLALTESVVQAFPLGGGAPVNLPGCVTGCSSRFQVSNAGRQVVFGANEVGDAADLTVVDANGQGATILAAQGSDNAFVIAEDSETLVFLDKAFGGTLSSIGLDGSGLTSLGSQGVVDIIAANAEAVVYATVLNADTATLRVVGADGAGDAALATNAVDEGFSSDGAFYLFRDGVTGGVGTLKFTSTQGFSAEEVAAGVDKASYQNDTLVVFIDSNGLLQVVDLTSNKATLFEDFINKFELLRQANGDAAQVAFTVPGGAAAGLYVEDL